MLYQTGCKGFAFFLDFTQLAGFQQASPRLNDFCSTLDLGDSPLLCSSGAILRDCSIGNSAFLFLPIIVRLLDDFHSTSHPGVRTFRKLTFTRFV